MRREPAARRVACVALAGMLAAALAGCTASGIVPASVPMDDGFRADATIGGEGVRLCLDTGADTMLLALAVVQRLGLPLLPESAKIIDSTGASRAASGAIECALLLGATTFHGKAVCVPMPARAGDGFIGMDAMRVGAWLFDAPQRVVHMAPGDGAERLVAAHGYRVTDRLPLGADEWRPVVTVRVDDRLDVTLLLDSGAESTALPADAVDALHLPVAGPRDEELARRLAALAEEVRQLGGKLEVTEQVGSFGIHGVAEHRSYHALPRLAVGTRTFTDLVVARDEHKGLLGRDVLGTLPWLLHGPRRELWLLAPVRETE